jgi:K+/H+ antiporter YhaU regulatory subunit KhtT
LKEFLDVNRPRLEAFASAIKVQYDKKTKVLFLDDNGAKYDYGTRRRTGKLVTSITSKTSSGIEIKVDLKLEAEVCSLFRSSGAYINRIPSIFGQLMYQASSTTKYNSSTTN